MENDDLVPDPDQLTLDLDPDNEFLWSDDAIRPCNTLRPGSGAAGGELSDYSLRRIGTDLEGYIDNCFRQTT